MVGYGDINMIPVIAKNRIGEEKLGKTTANFLLQMKLEKLSFLKKRLS